MVSLGGEFSYQVYQEAKMDPMALILTALQATSISSNLVMKKETVKDAHVSLRDRVQQKFVGTPGAELALSEYEADPATWEAPLKKALVQVQADQDKQIIEAAQYIMKLIQPQQLATKYDVQSSSGGTQGIALGNYQSIAIHFGDEERGK